MRALILAAWLTLPTPPAEDAVDGKPWSLSVGVTAISMEHEEEQFRDESFAGFGINLTRVFMEAGGYQLAARGSYARLGHSSLSELDITALEGNLLVGYRLDLSGIRAYASAGLFTEDWDHGDSSRNHSGLQLGGGFGYAWERLVVELGLDLRQASQYDLDSDSMSVYAAELTAGYRF